MTKSTEFKETNRENDLIYNSDYYQKYNGLAYGRNEQWLTFFGGIADNIARSLRPKTLMEVGCAFGFLVESLRDRGVYAFGIDVSEFAVSKARPDIKKYLSAKSVLEPFEKTFDLIVCIEVIEHIKVEDCDLALKNMCDAADAILLATIPDDFDDPTHFNVNAPIYWIKKFQELGFSPDIGYDAGYLTPYAILFRKSKVVFSGEIENLYGEKKLQDLHYSRVTHERNQLAAYVESLEIKNQEIINKLKDSEEKTNLDKTHISNLQNIVEFEKHTREQLHLSYRNSTSWRLTKPIRVCAKIIKAFFPLISTKFIDVKNSKITIIPKSSSRRWVLIRVLKNGPGCHLSLKTEKTSLPMMLLYDDPGQTAWIARIEPSGFDSSLVFMRGEVSRLVVTHLSPFSSWRKIIFNRLKSGNSVLAGFKFAKRIIGLFVKGGFSRVFSEFWTSQNDIENDYQDWVVQNDNASVHEAARFFEQNQNYRPKISIILPVYNTNLDHLRECIQSVKDQSYQNWELCICNDGSTAIGIAELLEAQRSDDRVKLINKDENGHISEASNSALSIASGEFVALLDHDDLLHPQALLCAVGCLNKDKDIDFMYSDEDKIDGVGNRFEPHFKSQWNPDLLMSLNYICHFSIIRKKLVNDIGGFRAGYEGAQDYDLFLRLTELTNKIQHIPHILYHWRAASGSTARTSSEKPYAHERAKKALMDAVQRRGLNADVLETGFGAYHRLKYQIKNPEPMVSIIIPTRDRVDLLQVCLAGLKKNTDYPKFEIIIVDNDSSERRSHKYFEKIASQNVKVLKYSGSFNYAAINNFAVSKTKAEIILLLNNDIEIIHPDWLTELVSHALRPEIGAVGCRLYYPDNHIQHDGIIVGMGGVAGYAHPRLPKDEIGEFGRSRVIQNLSAVTAAVLAVSRHKFIEVGGLDEKNLTVAFNDVDLCLKLGAAGYRNLYTPFAELIHHESISRGPDTDPEKVERFKKEIAHMKSHWSKEIDNDPFYNPNLSLRRGYFIDSDRHKSWPWEK